MPPSAACDARRPNASGFAEDVAYYLSLTPRQLPSRYLYDELGSSLFEAICRLPWYRLTRTELQLLDVHAPEIYARAKRPTTLVELGPGSGEKISSVLRVVDSAEWLTVHLVDVSPSALEAAAHALGERPTIRLLSHCATYDEGLSQVDQHLRPGERTLALFLGSNIGNFDPPGADALLRRIRTTLGAGDSILLGADLVRAEPDLLLAYDDPLGVTAAFNRNLLVRINRELDADFELDAFAHRAVWNSSASRMEMHLVSRRPQCVRIPLAGVEIRLDAGETIWTESSYKYRPLDVVQMLRRAGFRSTGQWTADHFSLTLGEAI